MENTAFQKKIQEILPGISFRFAEPMKEHTSFRIGGPVEIMAFPKDAEELREILKASKLLDINVRILGAGTNILAPDAGISGLVICLKDCLDGMELLPGDRIRVSAGVSMARAAMFAAGHSLSGLEFACGIPGSCGGAVVMNAGAYGGQVSDVIESCTLFDTEKREILTLKKDEMELSYRHSILSENKNLLCVSATFVLNEGIKEEIDAFMRDIMQRRISKQPLEYPSAGSVFKRPAPDLFVGKMIEDSGLKGYTVGGAQVSEKHAGFIINVGGATAKDVLDLVEYIKKVIRENYGVELECEIRRVGNGE